MGLIYVSHKEATIYGSSSIFEDTIRAFDSRIQRHRPMMQYHSPFVPEITTNPSLKKGTKQHNEGVVKDEQNQIDGIQIYGPNRIQRPAYIFPVNINVIKISYTKFCNNDAMCLLYTSLGDSSSG